MMDAFQVITKEIDEKVAQLSNFLTDGKAESYEHYKSMCGEIRGLLLSRGYTLDLKQRMESSDE